VNQVKVAVVGGGMAGLTAALRLAERGCAVTVYEAKPYVGGQFGAHTHGDGVFHEHCYHMLLNWYNNFWRIVDDIGLGRERDFEPRTAVRNLRAGAYPHTSALVNPGSPRFNNANFFSGVASPPDVFLGGYTLVDLLTQRFPRGRILDEYSVNAFVQSRPYASEASALLQEETLAKAFACPSYLSSARSYQKFIKYGFRHPEPMLWIVKGDVERHFHRHLRRALRTLGVEIRTGCTVTRIDLANAPASADAPPAPMWGTAPPGPPVPYRASAIAYAPSDGAWDCVMGEGMDRPTPAPSAVEPGVDAVDYLVLAVPPVGLGPIVRDSNLIDPQLKLDLSRITKQLVAKPMASLDLHFKTKLPGLPKDHVVCIDSEFSLSFIDNSQAWPNCEGTVLNAVAADFEALNSLARGEAFLLLLQDLMRYVPLSLDDVDWARTHLQANVGETLFVNEVGSGRWRPGAVTPLPNVFLAGDYCMTVIDVTTVEGAVVSGLQAAEALRQQARSDRHLPDDHPLARPVEIIEPDTYPDFYPMAIKLWMAPWAYAAKGLSWLVEQAGGQAPSRTPLDMAALATRLATAPYVLGADWLRTAWTMWSDLFSPRPRP
jgi:predicted NAD/FAD-dependent oxidoreductase